MHNYHSTNETLPMGRMGRGGAGYASTGDPTGSKNRRTWAFSILPYIEATATYNNINFDYGFDASENRTVYAMSCSYYLCPTDRSSANSIDVGLPTSRAKGNYVVNWGKAHYDQAALVSFNGPLGTINRFEGAPFGLDIAVPFAAITDGQAKFNVSDRRGDIHNDDPNAAMFMGYSPPNATTPDQMPVVVGSPSCIYPWGSNPPCNTSAPAFNAARSQHRGGVQVLMADGSTRFITTAINVETWRSLSTSQGPYMDDDSY